jgi:transposase
VGRNLGAPAPCALPPGTRTPRPRGQSDRRHHRQPDGPWGLKRGASLDPSGYDAGKKTTGRKRHVLVDTLGLLLSVLVHSADIQDRHGAIPLLRQARRSFPFIERIFADGGYQGAKTAAAVAKTGAWKLEIVKRSDLHRFVVLPKRWIVERTLAWISRNRRLARDFERHARKAAAFVRLAMIRIMLRRLAATASS